MKTLSVKQPWAYLLCSGIKPIENRIWKTNYRGRVLIHAGKSRMGSLFNCLTNEQLELVNDKLGYNYDFEKTFIKGAIIGSVEIVDCVLNHPSIWAEKSTPIELDEFGFPIKYDKKIYNWVVADPIIFDQPILNIKGNLRFWDYGHTYYCPHCAYPLHLQYLGDGVTDAFCFQCGKDIGIQKMVK